MQGKVVGNSIVIMDSFALPVQGTETRVNAAEAANEYMVEFLTRARELGQLENAVGWYHSHPGYGCWLSGIDVGTQKTQQLYQDPFLAVVIDPDRTVSAGKVEIGAFRTFPEEYVKAQEARGNQGAGEFQSIPLAKIEDFGAHANHYYSLEVSHFKSTLDAKMLEALWNKYWVQTLSASPLFSNREYGTKQIQDLAHKITQEEKHLRSMRGGMYPQGDKKANLAKIVGPSKKIQREEEMGLLAAAVKGKVFGVAEEVKDEEMKT